MLLSNALKMQQDAEDRKNEVIIEGLEDKIKELEESLKEKDSRRLPRGSAVSE
jgi:hypothetical protein